MLTLAACFKPTAATGVPCASNGDCPGNQVCDPQQTPPTCVDQLDPLAPDSGTIDDDAAMPSIDGAAPRTIPPGAALWLQMDDAPANGATDSAGAHAVTCTGACPALVPGVYGSAYRFNGAQRLETPDAPELRPGQAFTLAAWVKLDALPSAIYGTPACKVLDATEASFCLSIRMNGKPTYYTTGNNTAEAAGTMVVGEWHHLAMTWDGATKKGYLDGALYATQAIATINASAQPFVVGAFQVDTYRVPGAIDDLVFYNRVLSTTELAQLATP